MCVCVCVCVKEGGLSLVMTMGTMYVQGEENLVVVGENCLAHSCPVKIREMLVCGKVIPARPIPPVPFHNPLNAVSLVLRLFPHAQ